MSIILTLSLISSLVVAVCVPANVYLTTRIVRQRNMAMKQTEDALAAFELLRQVNAKNEATIRHLTAMIEDQVMAAPMNGNAACP